MRRFIALDKLSIAASSGHSGNKPILACAYDSTPQREVTVVTVGKLALLNAAAGKSSSLYSILCARAFFYAAACRIFLSTDQTAPQMRTIKILSKGAYLL